MTGMMNWFRQLEFASDAARLAMIGGAFVAVAIISLIAERRRNARARSDRVGFMPWTGIFLTCTVIGGGLLLLSMPTVLFG